MDNKKYIRLTKKYIKKQPMPSALADQFRKNGLGHLLDNVIQRTAQLIEENRNVSKATMEHFEQILPCISFYEALLNKTGNQNEALKTFEKWCFIKVRKMASVIPYIMKIPGLYKKVPWMMKKLLVLKFGNEAGFEYIEKDCENGFAVDITSCPYITMCSKYNHPELTKFFCINDDICYANMHPKLVWARTHSLGMGGNCCDFKLYIKN